VRRRHVSVSFDLLIEEMSAGENSSFEERTCLQYNYGMEHVRLLDCYHICHTASCIELLLAWFWCAVGVIYQMSEEL